MLVKGHTLSIIKQGRSGEESEQYCVIYLNFAKTDLLSCPDSRLNFQGDNSKFQRLIFLSIPSLAWEHVKTRQYQGCEQTLHREGKI